jgi:DNA-binding GntR family transcriptional regulator
MNICVPAYSQLRDILREEIITGVIPAQTRLTINEVADKFKVSHMPVREAFQWLQGEGLIEIIPNKGARVLSLTMEFISNIYDVRSVLEGLLARTGLEHFTEEDFLKMREYYNEFCAAVHGGDINTIWANDKRFHQPLFEKSINKPAREIFEKYSALLSTLRKKYGFGEGRILEMVRQHEEILSAIKARDPDRLETVCRKHAAGAKKDLLKRIEVMGTI